MRIISWNIRAGGGVRVDAILRQIERWSPDLVGLCEFRATPPSQRLAAGLYDLGFEYQATTAAVAAPSRNALLIASRRPLQRHALRTAPLEPGRCLVATVSGDRPFLSGLMHVPLAKRKLAFMESITAMVDGWRRGPAVFLGDTNSGWPVLDEQTRVFGPETVQWLDGLQSRGWRDAFRHLNGEERFYTWYSPNGGNGFRLDQAFVNRSMMPRLEAVRYEWGRSEHDPSRRDALSDHAALILDFQGDQQSSSLPPR